MNIFFFCTALQYTRLNCTVLHCTALHWTPLYSASLHCIININITVTFTFPYHCIFLVRVHRLGNIYSFNKILSLCSSFLIEIDLLFLFWRKNLFLTNLHNYKPSFCPHLQNVRNLESEGDDYTDSAVQFILVVFSAVQFSAVQCR